MYHIILVEDDEQIRKSLTELLTYKGYTVTAVEGEIGRASCRERV